MRAPTSPRATAHRTCAAALAPDVSLLPPTLRAVFAAAHRRALEEARGRVLDLSPHGLPGRPGPDVSEVVTAGLASGGGPMSPAEGSGGERFDRPLPAWAAEGSGSGPFDRPFDTVVSVLHLAGLDDPASRLVELRAMLAPGGRLRVVEPYRRAGWRGTLTDLASPWVRGSTGLRIDHPVPAVVRSAGYTIVAVQRRTLPTVVLPMRALVELTAVPSETRPPTSTAGAGRP